MLGGCGSGPAEVTVRRPSTEPRAKGHLEGPPLGEKSQTVGKCQALGNSGRQCPSFSGSSSASGHGAETPSHPSRHVTASAREKQTLWLKHRIITACGVPPTVYQLSASPCHVPLGHAPLGPVNNTPAASARSHFTDSESDNGAKPRSLSYEAKLPPSPGEAQAGLCPPADKAEILPNPQSPITPLKNRPTNSQELLGTL